jgi:hypothetical protein
MANFLDRYTTDKSLEDDGIWIDYGDGLKVKMRRLNCQKSKDVRRKLEKPYAKQFRGTDMPDSIQEQLLNKQIAKAIVVDWEGVPNPESPAEMLPCTEDNVLMMMEKFADFRDDILAASMERSTFQREQLTAAEGNSSSSSSGS